jgi:hypothetical protein
MALAARGADGVVAEDYYRRGLQINRSLARQQRAADLGLAADLRVTAEPGGLRVRAALGGRTAVPPSATLQLRFVHPGSVSQDRSLILARMDVSDDGRQVRYVGTLPGTLSPEVAWRVVLDADSWRLDGDYRDGRAVMSTSGAPSLQP